MVGIARDTRMVSADAPPAPILYIPHAQKQWHWLGWMTLIVRAEPDRDPRSLAPAVRDAVRELDARLPVHRVATVEELYGESTARRRFATTLLTAFAALALLLGTVGMYGVLSYAVAQRRREIGIRLALGAGAGEVIRAVLGQAFALTALGIVLGIAAALAATRLLGALLYEVSPPIRSPTSPWRSSSPSLPPSPPGCPRGGRPGSIRWWCCERRSVVSERLRREVSSRVSRC